MNYKKNIKAIQSFFISKDTFSDDEWIVKSQIFTMLIVDFFLGIGIFPFAYIRLTEGNIIVGTFQVIFSLFLFISFFILRKNKKVYPVISIMFFLFFFIYTGIIFFYVPQNSLNILWVISVPILIFFFLNKVAGIVMFSIVFGFILSLIFFEYDYTMAEYITLIGAFFVTTFITYMYENIKESEKKRLLLYNDALKIEIDKQTKHLKELNATLQSRVKEEVEKQLAQEEILLRQSRMASMGEMIDAIAHQWRQPLMNINVIMMNIDSAVEKSVKTSIIKEKILDIFSITSHMSQTIEDFRNLLKEEKEKNKFIVSKLVYDVLLLMKNNLKGIDIKRNLEENIVINSYKSELSQVIIILLGNSLDALHLNSIEDKKIGITLWAKKGYLFLTIEDNAGGIKKSILDKIFDPYFTTKKQKEGTGLGLYIAKIILEHSIKGKITVSNTKTGVIFKLIIPLD